MTSPSAKQEGKERKSGCSPAGVRRSEVRRRAANDHHQHQPISSDRKATCEIELYLNTSGDDIDRAEACTVTPPADKLTSREISRTTTFGAHDGLLAEKQTYVVTDVPATVIETEVRTETTGKTLTLN